MSYTIGVVTERLLNFGGSMIDTIYSSNYDMLFNEHKKRYRRLRNKLLIISLLSIILLPIIIVFSFVTLNTMMSGYLTSNYGGFGGLIALMFSSFLSIWRGMMFVKIVLVVNIIIWTVYFIAKFWQGYKLKKTFGVVN